MESGSPSGKPDEPQALEAALGHFRDALGSVKNLEQGLHSVRVGPRSIESVLPDVRDSCAAIESSAREVLDRVARRLPDRTAVDELLAWLGPRARELDRVLTAALGKPVNAKARLGLEQDVARLSRELEAGRALVDLLDDAVRGSRFPLDLAELVRHARVSRDASAHIEARVAPGLSGEVLVNPRVCGLVMGIGASLVHQRSGSTPIVSRGTDACLVIGVEGAGTEVVLLPTVTLLAPTLSCARAAARACGLGLRWDEAAARFSVTLPP
ncbi:MAG: hypothetical protein HYZ29_14600 [Myxococcales bacterium]|nr:hypothetical protein [Myxococcales bacterium]